MATAEEILAKMTAVAETEAVCIIDPATRTISVPADFALLGVESDEKAERIKFRCPKVVGDNLDLTKFGIRINYRNASGEKDGYVVGDVAVDGEDITFSWLLGRKVTKYKGDVTFIVCAVRGTENEWNTTLATAKVLEGLEAEISGDEEDETLLEQLVAVTSQKLTEMSLALTEAKTQTEKTVQATKDAEIATKNAQDAAQAVFDQQYILTSETRFVGETAVEPSGEGAAIIKELQGGTKQEKTNGYNLIDISTIEKSTKNGVTVKYDGENIVVNGETTDTSFFYIFLKKTLEIGEYGFTVVNEKIGTYIGVRLENEKGSPDNDTFFTLDSANKTIKVTSTQENNRLLVRIGKGAVLEDFKFKVMVCEGEPKEFEPYTGAEPSPSPDYPQEIKAIGGNGWFDGKLTVGGYQQNTGIYKDEYENYYTDFKQEYIPCKQGDIISIQSVSALTAKDAWFYREDKSFIKSISTFGNAVAPEEAAYFRWDIKKTTTTWPNFASVGKIAILKNGKYAANVETVGKNLFDFEGVLMQYGEKSDTQKIGENEFLLTATGSLYRNPFILSEEDKELTLSGIVKDKVSGSGWRIELLNSKNEEVAELKDNGINRAVGIGSKVRLNFAASNAGGIFKNIMICDGNIDTPYEPYKSSTAYIPLDEPLYKGDKIYLEDGELWEYRENAKVVFDGSEDENWGVNSSNNGKYVYLTVPNIRKRPAILFCDKFVYFNDTDVGNSKITGITNSSATSSIYITMIDDELGIDDATQWKTWLQSNPIEVVYKLATPTRKKLGSAEAFNIRTFDERTYIEVVGSKELGTENTFIVPRNQIGGLATDAFATAKRNEIQAAEQTNLASRIAALEALAVKER